MSEVRRLEPLPTAKVTAVWTTIASFVGIGLYYALLLTLYGLGQFNTLISLPHGAATFLGFAVNAAGLVMSGLVTLVTVPIFAGLGVFAAGLVGAWLYNRVADSVGGVELTLEQAAKADGSASGSGPSSGTGQATTPDPVLSQAETEEAEEPLRPNP